MATATFRTENNHTWLINEMLYKADVGSPGDADYEKGTLSKKFRVFISFDEAVDGLSINDISLTSTQSRSATFVKNSLTGSKRLYILELEITSNRPLTNTRYYGTITLTLAANSVTQGNAETTFTFNWEWLFAGASSAADVYAYSEWELVTNSFTSGGYEGFEYYNGHFYTIKNLGLQAFDTDGNRVSSKDISLPTLTHSNQTYTDPADFIFYNGYIILTAYRSSQNNSAAMFFIDMGSNKIIMSVTMPALGAHYYEMMRLAKDGIYYSLEYTSAGPRKKYTFFNFDDIFKNNPNTVELEPPVDYEIDVSGTNIWSSNSIKPRVIDYEEPFFYDICRSVGSGVINSFFTVISEDYKVIPEQTIPIPYDLRQIFLRITHDGDYIYLTERHLNKLYRLPKYKLRKPKRKQIIYPIFVSPNSTLDLTKYVEGADILFWEEDFDVDSKLSLSNSGKTLNIGAYTTETALEIRLRATNRRGTTALNEVKFYIVVQIPQSTPVWYDVSNISVNAGEVVDISNWVENYDSITLVTAPAGITLTSTDLRIGNNGGSVTLRATKGSNSADKTFVVDIIEISDYSSGDAFGYAIEIAGITIPEDDMVQSQLPVIQESLDPIKLNDYKVNISQFALKYRDGYYLSDSSENFWEDNNLALNGYQEIVKIFVVSGGTKRLLFTGVIMEVAGNSRIDLTTFILNDLSYKFKGISTFDEKSVQQIGLEKYARSFKSNTESYEGIYNFEGSLLPILVNSIEAWSNGTDLTFKNFANPSEGVVVDYSAVASGSDVRTQGGFLPSVPLTKHRIPYLRKAVKFWMNKLVESSRSFAANIDFTNKKSSRDCFQNKGNLQYNTQKTRITHFLQDWVYDSGGHKVYALLSNKGDTYKDMLIEHDLASDTERIVREFDATDTALRLAYAGSGIFYIGVAESIKQDKSSFPVPPDDLEVVSKYDPVYGAKTKILKYVLSTDALTTHVASTDSYPFLPGSHYWVGFGNDLRYTDWQGIQSDNRTAFEVYGGELYYRFATDSNFGVAAVNASGTTRALIGLNLGSYFNHLKFDFDISDTGVVYMVDVAQTATGSSVNVRKHEAGTTSLIHTTTQTFVQQQDTTTRVLPNQGGWWSGIHEVALHGNILYIAAEMGRTEVTYDDDDNVVLVRSPRKGAGQGIYTVDVSQSTPTLSFAKGYDFVQEGGRSFTVFRNEVWFVESPDEIYKYPAYNPDFDFSYSVAYNQNISVENSNLKTINQYGTEVDKGALWYSTVPYKATCIRMLPIGDSLNVVAVYNNPGTVYDNILRPMSELSRADNFQWLKYGKDIEFILDTSPTGDLYNVIVEVSKKINAIFNMKDNRVNVSDRSAIIGQITSDLLATDATIHYTSERSLPSTGAIMIGTEIIEYSVKTDTLLSGLKRGVNNSEISNYQDESKFVLIDKTIKQFLPNSVQIKTDVNRFFNIIRSSNFATEVRSANLGDKERPLILDLGLSRHDDCWAELVLEEYLKQVENIERLVSFSVPPDFSLTIGDIITFQDNQLTLPVQIIGLSRSRDATKINARSVTVDASQLLVYNTVTDGADGIVTDGADGYLTNQ